MRNWFKRKSKKDKLAKALLDWFEENENTRAAFMVILDEEEHLTTCGLYGNGMKIVDGIVNEAMEEEDIAHILLEATSTYCELKFPTKVEEPQPVEEKPKRRRKKTDKVVS